VDLTITPHTDAESGTYLQLQGSVDLESCDRLLESARAQLAGGGAELVLDLSGVTFMDSSGLGALITLGRECEDAGSTVVLQAPSDRVMRLIDTAGLQDVWTIRS
jgi:anti-sigma B factor antagonist